MKGEGQANWHRFGYSDDCISIHCRVIRFCPRWLFWNFYSQHFLPSVLCMWICIPRHDSLQDCKTSLIFTKSRAPVTLLCLCQIVEGGLHSESQNRGAMLPRVCSLRSQFLAIVHDRLDSLSLPRSFFNWAHSFSCSALGLLECLC